ncbi:MAG: hypothetical protein ACSHW4_17085 [Cellulophaga sp.]|uniref:hypothetical protein n=1 Tax=unclassified Cellulophaga TaxID=2634405 RepID=UPI0026E2175B|nr:MULTISPECIES: hypothetical protein [unclassified Cellulophaga]MDO6489878.1 hypothetical protein [Cellulophaga sp. 2_MG-2023]MDO6494928.1 hypothetical protein [Cellulophaga sp. 3_MG-2023]
MKMKFCLSCNKELVGRSDKKFCDTECRSTYHNTNRPLHEISIQKINSALRKNRSLLAHFCPSGKSTVKKEVLLKLGYRLDLFTHMYPFKTGAYFFCYEFGYLPIKENGVDKMLIVHKQEYMSKLTYSPWDIKIIK